MRVLHINAYEQGGAARAAQRLDEGLRQAGVDSRTLVRLKKSSSSHVLVPDLPRDPRSRIARAFRRRRLEMMARAWDARRLGDLGTHFSLPYTQYNQLSPKKPARGFEPHILNFHWIQDLVDLPSFLGEPRSLPPIVWTLHDMAAFTGGCHYSMDCGRFVEQCGNCPLVEHPAPDDISALGWREKKRIFDQLDPKRFVIVTPSQWLAGEARRSSLLAGKEIRVIPYGLETEVFAPVPREWCRDVLRLPRDEPVILFISERTDTHRKGADLFWQGLRQLKGGRVNVLLVGQRGSPPPRDLPPNVKVHAGGFVSVEMQLAVCYNAADVTVVPSRWDNHPNTVIESMSCGTPVVGFRASGVEEMIRHGETGLLAEPFEAESLGNCLEELLSHPEKLPRMREEARQQALAVWPLEKQARAYTALYEELLTI